MKGSNNCPARKKLFLLWCKEKIPSPDRKTIVRRTLFFAALAFLVIYSGGIAGQLNGNYQDYLHHGGLTGNTLIKLPDLSLPFSIQYALTTHYGHSGMLFMLVIISLIYGYIKFGRWWRTRGTEKDRNVTKADTDTYGTAGWMSSQDMTKVLDIKPIQETGGTIFGTLIKDRKKVVSLPVNTRLNQNTAVYGISGSGKTTAFVINQIIQCVKRGESIVMTDTKGDLYSETASYVKSKGYTVKLFNLVNPEHSDSWNCLSEIEGNLLRAQTFVNTIMNNTSSGKNDYFWNNCEMNLLLTLSLYVEMAKKEYSSIEEQDKHMGTVYDLLSKDALELQSILGNLPEWHPAKRSYNIYRKSAENVSGNVALGLGNRLQVFQSDAIRDITSYKEIDLSLPAREKCAYYVVISDQDRTFDFLSSLFFSFLFIDTIRYADRITDKQRGKCDIPIKIIFDEFNNIGMIPDFQDKISTIRSRRISADIIFQNIPQLKLKYPEDIWQIILGNCDSSLFLGCTDALTSKQISDRSGTVSVKVQGKQKWLPTIRLTDFTTSFRQNSSVGKRMLLTADEVERLPENQALLILRGQNLLKLEKYEYWNHPESKRLNPTNINEYLPEWQKQKEARLKAQKAQQEQEKQTMQQKTCGSSQKGSSTHTDQKSGTGSASTRRRKQIVANGQQSLFNGQDQYHQVKPDKI